MEKLEWVHDRRYAIRKAIERSADEFIDALWEQNDETINKLYEQLWSEDYIGLNLEIYHPEDIEPTRDPF